MNSELSLVDQARSSDADVRQRAALHVAQLMNESDLPLMLELLGDKDWRVRKTIVDGFVRSPTRAVVRGLLGSLHDPENAGKRNSATEALMRIGDAIVPAMV